MAGAVFAWLGVRELVVQSSSMPTNQPPETELTNKQTIPFTIWSASKTMGSVYDKLRQASHQTPSRMSQGNPGGQQAVPNPTNPGPSGMETPASKADLPDGIHPLPNETPIPNPMPAPVPAPILTSNPNPAPAPTYTPSPWEQIPFTPGQQPATPDPNQGGSSSNAPGTNPDPTAQAN